SLERKVSKRYFFGSGATCWSGAAVAPGAGACCASCLMLSVIIPMVHPEDESRIASSAFTALTYFALSSASKKMTGGPCVASLLFATRKYALSLSCAVASVRVSLFRWQSPDSSTLKTTCVRSGGGGSFTVSRG